MNAAVSDWLTGGTSLTLWAVGRELRVDTSGVQVMATRWGASAGDVHQTAAPTGLGLSCQASAAAVDAAHVDVAAFTAGLAARVGELAAGVIQANTNYRVQDAVSSTTLAGLRSVVSE